MEAIMTKHLPPSKRSVEHLPLAVPRGQYPLLGQFSTEPGTK